MMRPNPAACIAGKRGVGAGKGRDQIDREQPGPIVRRRVGEERMLIGAGIVDDNIERPVLRHDLLHHAGVGDIELRRGRADLPGETRSHVAISRSPMTTWAPASAKLRTIAAPMPFAPPETKARRRSSRPKGKVPDAGTFLASRKRRLAPFDHGGEPFAGVGHAGQFGHGSRFLRAGTARCWCRSRSRPAAWSPPVPSARRRPVRAPCQRCIGELLVGNDLGDNAHLQRLGGG